MRGVNVKLTLTIGDAIARLTSLLGPATYTNPRGTFARWIIAGRFAVCAVMQSDGLAVVDVLEPERQRCFSRKSLRFVVDTRSRHNVHKYV